MASAGYKLHPAAPVALYRLRAVFVGSARSCFVKLAVASAVFELNRGFASATTFLWNSEAGKGWWMAQQGRLIEASSSLLPTQAPSFKLSAVKLNSSVDRPGEASREAPACRTAVSTRPGKTSQPWLFPYCMAAWNGSSHALVVS